MHECDAADSVPHHHIQEVCPVHLLFGIMLGVLKLAHAVSHEHLYKTSKLSRHETVTQYYWKM